MVNVVTDISKINGKNKAETKHIIPVMKRASTKNLAFLFNMAARILKENRQLVICINYYTNTYILSKNEQVYIKSLYGNWLLAYIKGFTNEKPTYKDLAERTGYSLFQIHCALNNGKNYPGYTLTYELMKEWGYIYEV